MPQMYLIYYENATDALNFCMCNHEQNFPSNFVALGWASLAMNVHMDGQTAFRVSHRSLRTTNQPIEVSASNLLLCYCTST